MRLKPGTKKKKKLTDEKNDDADAADNADADDDETSITNTITLRTYITAINSCFIFIQSS